MAVKYSVSLGGEKMNKYLCIYNKPYIEYMMYYLYANDSDVAMERFNEFVWNTLGERCYDMENLFVIELNNEIEIINA